MKHSEYATFDAIGLAELVNKGEVTSEELARLVLSGIETLNPRLNAIVETFPDRAEAGYLSGLSVGPLHGVPFLNKDLSFAEAGKRMEMGSQLTAQYVSAQDQIAIQKLRAAGTFNLGRTTTPEFGLVGVTESRVCGITRNPWDPETTPSGSSGGSAAVVSAGIVPFATASDGGGSIRGPAANCGLIGLKPTRGRVSLAPNRGESLSGLGVIFAMTKTMRDTALLLDLMQGNVIGDPHGPVPPMARYAEGVGKSFGPLRIAVSKSMWGHEVVDPEISDCLDRTVGVLQQAGHMVEDATPPLEYEPFLDATLKVWSANLAAGVDTAALDMNRTASLDTLQSTTMAMYEFGKRMSASDLINALGYFQTVCRVVAPFFVTHDLLITPSSCAPPQKIGVFECDPKGPVDIEDWNREIYKHDGFYPLYNTTGQPAISLPLGQTRTGMPIGIQLASAVANEALLIQVGSFLEHVMPWSKRRPPVHVSHIG